MSCLESLKEKNYRITPQRAMISQIIHESEAHVRAEDIYKRVKEKYPKVFRSTVHRNLNLMEKLGLVTRTDIGDGIYRYHSAEKGHHHHLICRNCGRISDLEEEALEPLKDTLIRQYNFIPELRHMAIFGRCASCQVTIQVGTEHQRHKVGKNMEHLAAERNQHPLPYSRAMTLCLCHFVPE